MGACCFRDLQGPSPGRRGGPGLGTPAGLPLRCGCQEPAGSHGQGKHVISSSFVNRPQSRRGVSMFRALRIDRCADPTNSGSLVLDSPYVAGRFL